MTQNGVVTRLLEGGRAEVAVQRSAACGGRCDGCETCICAPELRVDAENTVRAGPGDRVILESGTGGVLGAAALVYLVPVLLFFLGYGAGAVLGLGEGLCVVTSLLGAALGAGLAVLAGRRRRRIEFRIVGFQR